MRPSHASPARRLTRLTLGLVLASLAWQAQSAPRALVQVSDAWIRPAVKAQSGTGGFMSLRSAQPVSLVGFSTSIAATAELHQMSMEGDVMRMRPLPSLDLPAGQAVALEPGGSHLMLMGLKKPLKVGDQVPLVLKFKNAQGKFFTQSIKVPVLSPEKAPGAESGGHDHEHHHDHSDH